MTDKRNVFRFESLFLYGTQYQTVILSNTKDLFL